MNRNNLILRSFQQGDKQSFLYLVNTAYRNLEKLTQEQVERLTSPPYFNSEGFFIAEKEGKPFGCVGVYNLTAVKYFELRYLAVKEALSNLPIVDELIKTALEYSASKQPKLVKAVTLTIQPYVEAYQRFGFKPVRRILRITWDPIKILEEEPSNRKITVTEIRESDVKEASHTLVEGLKPYWDWWIEEEGGDEKLLQRAAEWMKQDQWLGAKVKNKIVSVAAVFPHTKGVKAVFSGVIVLPEFRMKSVGSTLMSSALNRARELGCNRLVVQTVAYLDALAPGAVLYLKSGGRIEAEYLQLIK